MQVAALRKAMGPMPDGRDWIVTVPRVGYRLVVPEPARAAAAGVDPPALAVLPFQVLGGAEDEGYFADGVVEDIIAALGRFRSFTVLSGSTSFLYRDRPRPARGGARARRALPAAGSVRRAGERLRITAELVDGDRRRASLGRELRRRLAEVFAFQDRITASVATVIEPQIQAAELGARPARAAGQRRGLRHLPAGPRPHPRRDLRPRTRPPMRS